MRYYFYNHDTPVRLSYDGRTVQLAKNTQFGLDKVGDIVAVVLDGFRYPVAEKYESVLRKRSVLAKLQNRVLKTNEFFEAFGHIALGYVKRQAQRYGELHSSGYRGSQAYAETGDTFGRNTVRIVFRVSRTAVAVSVYCEERIRYDKRFTDQLSTLVEAIAKRMAQKFAIEIGDFRTQTATMANITLHDGKKFSGFVWSHAANWTFAE